MAGQVVTGARAVFIINGQKVAFASGVNYNINHNTTPIDVLDKPEPEEHAVVGYSVDMSCTTFRVPDQSPISTGIQPKLQDILTAPSKTVEVQDSITGKTLLFIEEVTFTGRSGSFDARGVWSETWNFVGIKASDEAGA